MKCLTLPKDIRRISAAENLGAVVRPLDLLNVQRGEASSLAQVLMCLFFRVQGGLVVDREGQLAVMHKAAIVVADVLSGRPFRIIQHKVPLHGEEWGDVGVIDGDVIIAIGPCVLMPKADGVHHLVQDVPWLFEALWHL